MPVIYPDLDQIERIKANARSTPGVPVTLSYYFKFSELCIPNHLSKDTPCRAQLFFSSHEVVKRIAQLCFTSECHFKLQVSNGEALELYLDALARLWKL